MSPEAGTVPVASSALRNAPHTASDLLRDETGLPVTVQDLGRAGLGRLGVSPSGAMDPLALRAAFAWFGHRAEAERLIASLEVDTSSFTRATGWRPRPFEIDARMLGPPEVHGL